MLLMSDWNAKIVDLEAQYVESERFRLGKYNNVTDRLIGFCREISCVLPAFVQAI